MKINRLVRIVVMCVTLFVSSGALEAVPAAGPLRVHPDNPRYFTDGTKMPDGSLRAVYLTGSHTWHNLQDGGLNDPPPAFDYNAFLDFLEQHNHNFFRLWAWESDWESGWYKQRYFVRPLPYLRTGPDTALDGKPRFDLTRFDPDYFQRLHDRVKAAQDRGLYVGVMLFQGFSVAKKSPRAQGNPWLGHPFHHDNNINSMDGDLNGDGQGYEVHTLDLPRVTRLQEAYVRQVIDTVGQFDNVIFEISNESHADSTEWQYHMIRFIHEYEKTKPKQHPVWMSFQWDGYNPGTNENLWNSPAEAISPRQNEEADYRDDPPIADGSKVVIPDTDHLWGIGGNASWVWKSFTRGMNPIFMDPYQKGSPGEKPHLDPKWDGIRRAMGLTQRYAERMNLAAMTPVDDPTHCSTRYCLRNPGVEYLVYQPGKGKFTVDLTKHDGDFTVVWFDPTTGKTTHSEAVNEGTVREFVPPADGSAVLHLKAKSEGRKLPPSGTVKSRQTED